MLVRDTVVIHKKYSCLISRMMKHQATYSSSAVELNVHVQNARSMSDINNDVTLITKMMLLKNLMRVAGGSRNVIPPNKSLI